MTKCKEIQNFDTKDHLIDIVRLEIQRFEQPMAKNMIEYFLRKYTSRYFYVIDISCDGKSDAHLLAGKEESSVHIFTIVVSKEFEGQGWGRKLLSHLFSQLKDDIDEVILEVNVENRRARRLYSTLGFSENSVIHGYYGVGTKAIKMIKRV